MRVFGQIEEEIIRTYCADAFEKIFMIKSTMVLTQSGSTIASGSGSFIKLLIMNCAAIAISMVVPRMYIYDYGYPNSKDRGQ